MFKTLSDLSLRYLKTEILAENTSQASQIGKHSLRHSCSGRWLGNYSNELAKTHYKTIRTVNKTIAYSSFLRTHDTGSPVDWSGVIAVEADVKNYTNELKVAG